MGAAVNGKDLFRWKQLIGEQSVGAAVTDKYRFTKVIFRVDLVGIGGTCLFSLFFRQLDRWRLGGLGAAGECSGQTECTDGEQDEQRCFERASSFGWGGKFMIQTKPFFFVRFLVFKTLFLLYHEKAGG